MGFIYVYLKPYRKLLFLALFCAIVNQVFSLLDPQIFRIIIDRYVSHFSDFSLDEFIFGVWLLLLASVWVAMISRIAKNIEDYLSNMLTQKIGMQLYQKTLSHLFTLPYKIFEDQQSGQILEKLLKARQNIQNFIVNMITILFTSVVGLTFVIIYASTVHWLIATMYGLLLPIIWTIMVLMSKKIKIAQSAIVKESADLNGATTETLRNIALVKSLWLEKQELDRLEDTNIQLLWLEIKKIKLIRILEFLQWTLINFVRVLLMATMFWLVYNQSISLGEFLSLYFYSFFIFSPLYQFGVVMQSYQEAKASDQLVKELLSLGDDAIVSYGDDRLLAIEKVSFDRVLFAYDTNKPVLHDVSWHAKQWQTIAFVWPSGSWKSTIIKLLLGLYQPIDGVVCINDKSLTAYNPQLFKQTIGYVSQESQLFAGTIKDNLLFVKPDATDAEIFSVLDAAQIKSLVIESSLWLDTKIGEWWLKLSGGQRQRLAIARALLRQPSLLIFDEATSSLDTLVEAEITQTIQQISATQHNMIIVIIAHRLSTIKHADTIFVLQNGSIVQQWKHDDLIVSSWLYTTLWNSQPNL
jgi:ATP-binding cassette, subfamily B, bacterial